MIPLKASREQLGGTTNSRDGDAGELELVQVGLGSFQRVRRELVHGRFLSAKEPRGEIGERRQLELDRLLEGICGDDPQPLGSSGAANVAVVVGEDALDRVTEN